MKDKEDRQINFILGIVFALFIALTICLYCQSKRIDSLIDKFDRLEQMNAQIEQIVSQNNP